MADFNSLKQAVGELDEEKVLKEIEKFIAQSPSTDEAQNIVGACQEGMNIVGELFEKGEYFIGDLIFAGELLTKVTDMLTPLLGDKSTERIGKIVLGTVEGDVHDIGKNIFKSMAEVNGFEVFDLGVDQPPAAFVEKVKEVGADIVGMSGLLGFSLDAMERTIRALQEAGLRDSLKVILGGQAVTPEFAEKCGADAATVNAQEGVKFCLGWVRKNG